MRFSKTSTRNGHASATSAFTFLLLLIFSIFALVLAGMGAAVYKNSTAHLNENYTSRTAISYVAEKIRQHDTTGAVSLSEIDEIPSIVLTEVIHGEKFSTYIYFHNNSLCELFLREGIKPQAEMGTRLLELSNFDFEASDTVDGMLTVTAVSPEGTTLTQKIYCRSEN